MTARADTQTPTYKRTFKGVTRSQVMSPEKRLLKPGAWVSTAKQDAQR